MLTIAKNGEITGCRHHGARRRESAGLLYLMGGGPIELLSFVWRWRGTTEQDMFESAAMEVPALDR